MARIRTIKPEFFTSDQIAECSMSARLLFVGLWCFADDGGNHPAKPLRAKMEIFPADNVTLDEVSALIDELICAGLLVEYDGGDGATYWHVTGFAKHQKIDRPSYKHPKFDEHSTIIRRSFDDHSNCHRRVPSPGMEWNGREGSGEGREWNVIASSGVPEEACSVASQAKPAEPAKRRSAKPPQKPASEPLTEFVFPTTGTTSRWVLPVGMWEKLGELYPGVDREREIRKAIGWCDAAGSKRKTPAGMPRFLHRWFSKAQDCCATKQPTAVDDPRGNAAAAARYLGEG